eukprot:CAMPEP_0203882304 /NCGR_PEP_ID=MMETSP0359-20131031/26537_1 /ASSEMBLY_ACC=CAM_ASM_000338 /TAXON_ID=268821 /ORGANISM="Scrippsiella Hangoei, Strain SHTV-5" /LENGTH=72 /DNA_ID=CAMNT_0050802331 /DNA_START=20 /DNA_END=235 /DNA_ORIENTATION=-
MGTVGASRWRICLNALRRCASLKGPGQPMFVRFLAAWGHPPLGWWGALAVWPPGVGYDTGACSQVGTVIHRC